MLNAHEIYDATGAKWLGYARQKLALLCDVRQGLMACPVLSRKLKPRADVTIHLTSADDENIIRIEAGPINGFLFHPRSGEIKWAMYRYFLGWNQHMAHFPYVFGTGWNPKGEPLPGLPLVYPMVDNDHGTRRISRRKDDTKWKYRRSTPENYGNLDWKGPNTARPDKEPNNIILAWKGPPSRYFAAGMKYNVTDQLHYDRYIYRGGVVIGTLPFSERQSQLGDDVPYYVLGAAVATDRDGHKWKVAVGKEYFFDIANNVTYSNFRVMAQRLMKREDGWFDEENNPHGWRIIYEGGGGVAASAPFHFNASGTEASAVSGWQIHTLTVNIDGLSANLEISNSTVSGEGHIEGGVTDGPYGGWSGAVYLPTGEGPVDPTLGLWLQEDEEQNLIGTSNYVHGGMGVRDEEVTAICAVDYIGDVKVVATVRQTIHAEHDDSVRTAMNASASVYPTSPSPLKSDFHALSTSGITNTSKRTVRVEFGSSEIVVFDEDVYGAYRSRYTNDYHIDDYYGNTPWHVTGLRTMRVENVDENTVIAGAVLFMDLRHDIAVVATQETYSKIASYTNQREDDGGGWQDKDDEYDVDGHLFCKIRIHGNPEQESDWYDGFVTTDDDDHITPGFPAWIGTVQVPFTWPVNTIHFRWSNQPTGSWAVDRNNNRFYSMLVKDGVYNYLTDGEPVALTKTPGDNPVFFPIAPV